ncbi:hypothetical protein [Stenotrophomonas sp. PSU-St19]
MKLELYSEPFSKNGNLAGEGFKRLLGRPNLNLLQTLVRESLQNVIDATLPGRSPEARIRLRKLRDTERNALSNSVLAQMPAGGPSEQILSDSLEKPELWVFEIADFGTVGLSGPVEADVAPSGEERANFVNFLKNVGAARDSHQGGGTYGYGKSSLYAMSSCSLVLVDSQTFNEGKPVRRLMACHLGEAFDASVGTGIRRFTGRHWWGMPAGSDSVAPATGAHALDLSGELGMFSRSEADSGTSIVIVDPELEVSSTQELGRELITCVLLNFWPRMSDSTAADRRLTVSIEIDGQPLDVPAPEAFPPLDLFCRALADIRSNAGSLKDVRSQRPAKALGKLAFAPGVAAQRHPLASSNGEDILAGASHIALMRPVELVVKYLRGAPYPDSLHEWAGVFVCSAESEVEEAFAQAEPPTHDDWAPDNLPKGKQQTMVRVGMRALRTHADTFVPTKSLSRSADPASPSLAATAGQMGRFLSPTSARGAGKPEPSRRGGPSPKKGVRLSSPEMIGLSLAQDGAALATFRVDLTNDGSQGPLKLIVEPKLVADGNGISAEDVPSNLLPRLHSVSLEAHDLSSKGQILDVGLLSGEVTAVVRMVKGAAVTVAVRVLSEDAA